MRLRTLTIATVAFIPAIVLAWLLLRPFDPGPAPTLEPLDVALNRLLADDPLADGGAWPLYQAILAAEFGLEIGPDADPAATGNALYAQLKSIDVYDLLAGDWDDPRLDVYKPIVDALMPALGTLDDASDLRTLDAPYRLDPPFQPTPPGDIPFEMVTGEAIAVTGALRNLNGAAIIGMRAAAENGDWSTVNRLLGSSLAMSIQTSRQPTVIALMSTSSMYRWGLEELRTLLNEKRLPADVVERLLETVDAWPFPGDSLDLALEGEAIQASHAAHYFSQSGDCRLRHDEVHAAIDDFKAQATALAKADMPTLLRERLVQRDSWNGKAGRLHIHLTPLVTSPEIIAGVALGIAHGQSDRHATRVMLLLELHHAQHGAWPESLIDAMTARDATDPTTGDLFEYERLPEGGDRPYELRLPATAPEYMLEHYRVLNPVREPLPDEFELNED